MRISIENIKLDKSDIIINDKFILSNLNLYSFPS